MLSLSCSPWLCSLLLLYPRATCHSTTTVSLALPIEPLIKRVPNRQDHKPFSIKVPSSQKTISCVKLIKTNKTNNEDIIIHCFKIPLCKRGKDKITFFFILFYFMFEIGYLWTDQAGLELEIALPHFQSAGITSMCLCDKLITETWKRLVVPELFLLILVWLFLPSMYHAH